MKRTIAIVALVLAACTPSLGVKPINLPKASYATKVTENCLDAYMVAWWTVGPLPQRGIYAASGPDGQLLANPVFYEQDTTFKVTGGYSAIPLPWWVVFLNANGEWVRTSESVTSVPVNRCVLI